MQNYNDYIISIFIFFLNSEKPFSTRKKNHLNFLWFDYIFTLTKHFIFCCLSCSSIYFLESLTVDHSEYNVLRVSLTLHSEDILSRFQKRVTHCCRYKVTISGRRNVNGKRMFVFFLFDGV
jgi:hypothetical protein